MAASSVPDGWESAIDDKGNAYFYHHATGASMYEHPVTVSWGAWFKLVDPSSFAFFYFNADTGESSWDEPEGFQLRQQTDRDITQDQQDSPNGLEEKGIQGEEKDTELEALLQKSEAVTAESDQALERAKEVTKHIEQAETHQKDVDKDTEKDETDEKELDGEEGHEAQSILDREPYAAVSADSDDEEEEKEEDNIAPLTQNVGSQPHHSLDRKKTLADQMSDQYFESIRSIQLEEPKESDREDIFRRTGDAEAMSVLAKMQKQLTERNNEKMEKQREEEEIRRRRQTELENAKKKKSIVTEAMKREWAATRYKKEKEQQERLKRETAKTKNKYFEDFWSEETGATLIDYHWSLTTEQDQASLRSPPAWIAQGHKTARAKKLPNPVDPETLMPKKELQHLGTLRVSGRPKILGTYDMQIIHTYTIGEQSNLAPVEIDTSASHAPNQLPPVSPQKQLGSIKRPQTVGSVRSHHRSLGVEHLKRPGTAGERHISNEMSTSHGEPHVSASSEQSTARRLHEEMNQALENLGEGFESLRRTVFTRIVKAHNLRVDPRLTSSTSSPSSPKKKKRNNVKQASVSDLYSPTTAQPNEEASSKQKRRKQKIVKKRTKTKQISKASLLSTNNEPFSKSIVTPQSAKTNNEPSSKSVLVPQLTKSDEKAIESKRSGVSEQALVDLFSELDTSGDGYVSLREMKKALKDKRLVQDLRKDYPALGLLLKEEICEIIFQSIDTDKSGDVSLEEFLTVFGRTLNESEEQRQGRKDFRKLFDAMDRDGDGSISIYELRDALKSDLIIMELIKQSPMLRPLLRAAAFSRISTIFLQFDEDGSGSLEWPEFEKVCQLTFSSS